MIWATVSSRSCFCWLYRASPSLAAKNIISLISVLTIWWCPCVSTLMISYFIISIFCFLQSSFSFALAFAKYEKCATPFPPELLCLIYILFCSHPLAFKNSNKVTGAGHHGVWGEGQEGSGSPSTHRHPENHSASVHRAPTSCQALC